MTVTSEAHSGVAPITVDDRGKPSIHEISDFDGTTNGQERTV